MKAESDSKSAGRLRGVSLGPGSPDLITLRALEALKKSDRIYYPAPARCGQNARKSRCFSILRHHGFETKARPVAVDMKHRSAADASYESARGTVLEDLRSGFDVAVVCEGCLSLYSTAFRFLSDSVFGGYFELVPGVPSPTAAAAEAGVCLALGDDRIAVIPGVAGAREMEIAVDSFETVIVVKPVRADKIVELAEKKNLELVYCRDLGGKRHLITASADSIKAGDFPYFSLFIIAKRLNRCRAE